MQVISLDVTQGGRPAPGALHLHGPLVEVILRGPSKEVHGHGIIDTGATNTCFDETAARRAGMPIVGSGAMNSATQQEVTVPVFAGDFEIPGFANFNVRHAFGVSLGNNFVALIGRDILSKTLLIYNGVEGRMSLFI